MEKVKGQVFTKKSLTKKDLSLTVRQIIDRAKAGNLPPLAKDMVYGGDVMIPRFSDPVELKEYTEAIMERAKISAKNVQRLRDEADVYIKEKFTPAEAKKPETEV